MQYKIVSPRAKNCVG